MTRQHDCNSHHRFFDALESRMLMSAVDGASNTLTTGEVYAPIHNVVEQVAIIADTDSQDTAANVQPDAAPGDWGGIVLREDSSSDLGSNNNTVRLQDVNQGDGDSSTGVWALTNGTEPPDEYNGLSPAPFFAAVQKAHTETTADDLTDQPADPAAGVVSPSTLLTARQILKNNTTAPNGGASSSAVQVLGTTFNNTIFL